MPHSQFPSMADVETITVKTIPHNTHRYETTGDWIWHPGSKDLEIRVSKTDDWRESMAVAVHEIVEALLCLQKGVDPDTVDAFDIQFEADRVVGDVSEPGDSLKAPYYHEHQLATQVEHIVTEGLGLHWTTYEDHLSKLFGE